MAERPRDDDREQRIQDDIVVDAYGPEEQALGWYYYLESLWEGKTSALLVTAGRVWPTAATAAASAGELNGVQFRQVPRTCRHSCYLGRGFAAQRQAACHRRDAANTRRAGPRPSRRPPTAWEHLLVLSLCR